MKTLSLILTLLVGATALAYPQRRIDINEVEKSSRSNAEKAEEMAIMGEQLLTPSSVIYANEVFTKALNMDPANFRARLYYLALRPMMDVRGFIKRLQGLKGKAHPNFFTGLNEISQRVSPGFRTFLEDGQVDIKNENEVQDVLGAVVKHLDDYREFLKANTSKTIRLNVKPNAMFLRMSAGGEEILNATSTCQVVKRAQGVYDMPDCPGLAETELDMGRAEFVALQHAAAAGELSFLTMTMFRMDGYIELMAASESTDMTTEDALVYLESMPEFGLLSKHNRSQAIKVMGLDFVEAAKWFAQYRTEYCGVYGEHLLRKGVRYFCYPATWYKMDGSFQEVPTDQALAMLELMFVGKAIPHYKTTYTVNGPVTKQVTSEMRIFSVFLDPQDDFKNLFPDQYTACGTPSRLKDRTAGGTFPKGDAESVFHEMGDFGRCDK